MSDDAWGPLPPPTIPPTLGVNIRFDGIAYEFHICCGACSGKVADRWKIRLQRRRRLFGRRKKTAKSVSTGFLVYATWGCWKVHSPCYPSWPLMCSVWLTDERTSWMIAGCTYWFASELSAGRQLPIFRNFPYTMPQFIWLICLMCRCPINIVYVSRITWIYENYLPWLFAICLPLIWLSINLWLPWKSSPFFYPSMAHKYYSVCKFCSLYKRSSRHLFHLIRWRSIFDFIYA